MPTPQPTLPQLLADAFAPDELDRLVLALPGADHWRSELPTGSTSRADHAARIVTFLADRGRIDADFFAALRHARSSRTGEIDALALALTQPRATSPRQPDPLAPFKAQVRERADLLAEALCSPAADRLSLVYVEVQLDPDETMLPEARHRLSGLRRIDDAFRHPHRLWALTGEAGSGKSTLLHHMALALLDDPDGPLPVPLRAPDLERGDTVESAVTRRYGARLARPVAQRVAEGKAVLLLDGLDEVLDTALACDAIRGICADASDCTVFLASRPDGYRRPGVGFLNLKLQPLAPSEQQRLLVKLGINFDAAGEALQTLRRRERMRRIAESPLLLTLAGLLIREGKVMPHRRADLYRDAVNLLVEGRHRLDQAPRLRDPDVALAALGRLALSLHGEARELLSDQEVKALLAKDPATQPGASKYGGDVRGLLEDLSRVAGLFVPDRPARPTGWLFPHRTFREYLAACALADDIASRGGVARCGPTSELERRLTLAKAKPALWGEVFALLTGLLAGGDAGALVKRLVEAGETYKLLLYRVLADAEGLKEETVWAVLGLSVRRSEWGKRAEVLQRLPTLVKDPGTAVQLLGRFARAAKHGADLWWAHHLLEGIESGRLGDGEEEVRAEAGALARRVFRDHRPEARAIVLAEIEGRGWWKRIPAGRFCRESLEDEDVRFGDDGSRRQVEMVRDFEMLAVPVTNALYERFDPEHTADRSIFTERLPTQDQAEVPASNVSWYEAVAFGRWLSESGAVVRLPVEVEWEYACRGGTESRFWSGNEDQDLLDVGWVGLNRGSYPHPVAAPPTPRGHGHPWGLYDLHGNVWEWCQDRWVGNRDDWMAGAAHDPSATPTPDEPAAPRAIRGGGWSNNAQNARSGYRSSRHPQDLGDDQGFRLVRILPDS